MYQQYNINRRRQSGCGSGGCGCAFFILIFVIIIIVTAAASLTIVFKSEQLTDTPKESISSVYGDDMEDILPEQKEIVDSCIEAFQNNDFELFNKNLSMDIMDGTSTGISEEEFFNTIRYYVKECYGENITLIAQSYETGIINYKSVNSTLVTCKGIGMGTAKTCDFVFEFILKESDDGWKYTVVDFNPADSTESPFDFEIDNPSEPIATL